MCALIPRRSQFVSVTLFTLLVITAGPGYGQNLLRRDPAVPPVALAEKGDLLLGVGAGYEENISVPLVGVRGDLVRAAVLSLAYAVADGVLVELSGDLLREIRVDRWGTPQVTPDERLSDGKNSGSGDFVAGVSFLVFGDAEGLAAGGRLGFTIPASSQEDGLGNNSLGVRLSLLGSYGRGRSLLTAMLSLDILEAPLENFEQNDVLAYGAELLYSPWARCPLRLHAGVAGRVSTRERVPVGTEDLGAVRFGVDYRLGRWLLDGGGLIGYAGNSADWGVSGGLSFLVGS